jgi:hypothetical protein
VYESALMYGYLHHGNLETKTYLYMQAVSKEAWVGCPHWKKNEPSDSNLHKIKYIKKSIAITI